MAERTLKWNGVAWRSRANAERYCSPAPWATAWNSPSRTPNRRPDSCGCVEVGWWMPGTCSAECDNSGWTVIIRKPRVLYHRTANAQGFIGSWRVVIVPCDVSQYDASMTDGVSAGILSIGEIIQEERDSWEIALGLPTLKS